MYKKSAPASSSTGSFATRRDPLDRMPERRNRDKEDVPSRYGGQRGSSSRGGDYEQRDADRSRGHGRDGRDNEDLRDGRDRQDRKERREETSRYNGGESLHRVQTRNEHPTSVRSGNKPAVAEAVPVPVPAAPLAYTTMIEIIANDRLGRKVRVKCSPLDTVGDLKKLIAAQTGTPASKIQLKKWYSVFKDHITLRDYEINDGMSLEMY